MLAKAVEIAALALVGLAMLAGSASAQVTTAEEGPRGYEREIYRYPGGGRVDPFRSLIAEGDMGVRPADLELRGIVYHADPSASVAVLTHRNSERRIQARAGERVGTVRILAIHPETVEVVVEELGVARRETLRIEKAPSSEGSR